MKNLILIVFFLFISFICRASDTITVWHVYYNGIKIKEYNEFNNKVPLILNVKDFKVGDSISIAYFSDVHCNDCLTGIMVRSEDDKFTMAGKNVGRGNPISFLVKYLIDPKKRMKDYQIFYIDSNGKNAISTKLFDLKIE